MWLPTCPGEAAGRALQKRRDERSASQRKVQRATAGGVSGFSQLQVPKRETQESLGFVGFLWDFSRISDLNDFER
jgi:hypothetical protein